MKEQLKQYIDLAFANAPQTKKNEELKEEVLGNLYEKYDDCLNRGMSEEEAYRVTVASIGDLSTLFEPMETKRDFSSNAVQKEAKKVWIPLYSKEEEAKQKTERDIGIAIAVMLYIFSLFPVILFENNFGAVGMFLLIAIATGILVYEGNMGTCRVSPALTEEQRFDLKKKRQVAAFMVSGSVMAYILCVCPVILFPNAKLSILAMFFLIALATAALILRGTAINLSALEKSEESTHEAPKAKEKTEKAVKAEKTVGQKVFAVLSGIYWALICAAYFIYSFATLKWSTSWLIFLYAGLAYLVVNGVYHLIIGKHRVGSILKIVISSILLAALLSANSLTVQSPLSFNLFSSQLIYDDTGYSVGNADFPAETSIQKLNIEWLDGSVEVIYWDNDHISILEGSEHTIGSDDQMRYFLNGDSLFVKFQGSHFMLFGNMPAKHLTVYLPNSISLSELDISAVSSSISVSSMTINHGHFSNVSGEIILTDCHFEELDLESVSGKIQTTGSFRELDVDTVSGDISLAITNTPDHIDIDGVSADITLAFPADVSGFSAKMDSLSGNIHTPANVINLTDSASFGDNHTDINIDTVSGDITITIG